MGAIFKREFRSFFTSPVGYVVLAVIACASGYFFFAFNIYSGSSDLSYVYGNLFTIVMLVLPILTMRLFSDEKRQRTDQALLTSPVSLTGIVFGKFFAALLMFALSLLITLVFAVVIAFQVSPSWSVVFGNFLGLLMVGGLIISIGLLISSLTESQLIAAICTLGVSVILIMMDTLSSIFSNFTVVKTVINFLSVSQKYSEFTTGILDYANVIFFLSMKSLFLFLTVRVLDSKRWN